MTGTRSFEWIFVVREIAESRDARIDELYERMDALVESHSGLTLITTLAEGSTAIQAAHEAILEMEAVGFTVRRTYLDLVTRADIAERSGKTRSAVDNWARGVRQKGFPAPVHLVGGGVWLWRDVSAWLKSNADDVSDGVEYPSMSDHARVDYDIVAGVRSLQPVVASFEYLGMWRETADAVQQIAAAGYLHRAAGTTKRRSSRLLTMAR